MYRAVIVVIRPFCREVVYRNGGDLPVFRRRVGNALVHVAHAHHPVVAIYPRVEKRTDKREFPVRLPETRAVLAVQAEYRLFIALAEDRVGSGVALALIPKHPARLKPAERGDYRVEKHRVVVVMVAAVSGSFVRICIMPGFYKVLLHLPVGDGEGEPRFYRRCAYRGIDKADRDRASLALKPLGKHKAGCARGGRGVFRALAVV